ncbi:hypothetical protein EZV62_001695 [Acer yangbiense]|uniref:CCHC-type domain-containing protein n=1 Tax=Acer yangbiense TaxID=1000413 RepID=A0A5C7IXB6_9ROSI|nr:hypothetical protein EZV62_001695 [Acer yangbiense]
MAASGVVFVVDGAAMGVVFMVDGGGAYACGNGRAFSSGVVVVVDSSGASHKDDISRLCAELSIHGKDEKVWSVQSVVTKAAEKKLDLCLVGKILSSKHVNRESFMAVIPRIWQTAVEIELVQDNTFMFSFRHPGDRFWVLFGGPWSFDNCLIVLEKFDRVGDIARLPFDRVVFWIQIFNAPLLCMTKEMGEFIGSCVGDLVDIDVGVTGECYGKYMRLRVAIDVSKPLKRFMRLELKQGVESMLLIRYEGLPEYCFHCGIIGHSYQACHARNKSDNSGSGMDFTYGPWLRATGVPGQHRGAGQSFPKGGASNQRAVRKNMDGQEGSRDDLHVDGSWSQSDNERVQSHSPNPVDRVEVMTSMAGKQVSLAGEIPADYRRDKKITAAGQENISGQACPSLRAGLYPSLRLSKVVIESYFHFKSGERSSGNGVGLEIEGRRVDVTKKKGKWKRWAREGGVSDLVLREESVEGRK